MKKIHIVAVAFQRIPEMKIFIQSWLNQTKKNWQLTIIHDGPSKEFDEIMMEYESIADGRISHWSTEERYNDYGHSLRDLGIKRAEGDYLLLTNADNYFIPKAIEFLNMAISAGNKEPDVVLFNMIHSHNRPGGRSLPPYSFFDVEYKRGGIDISSAIVRMELAKITGFNDRTHDADATYFEEIRDNHKSLLVYKLPNVLFVHN